MTAGIRHYISVAPGRVRVIRRALARARLEECRAEAQAMIERST
jgi:hypothetical protein